MVKLVETNEGWSLTKNGSPYYIKGAGGQTQLNVLQEIGGNTIRTWSLDNAEKFLDEAHDRGLMVMMGLWVQHERHGFDYNDSKAVQKQLDFFRKRVTQLKDHPALLLWGVGNEVDLFYTNTKVWNAVQDIAKMIHELDPNHPTCTVTAGLDAKEVELISKNCPDIDIYGINTYSELGSAINNISKFGWNGPYLITEWGPNGHWEVEKTAWNIPIEQTSSEKAASYRERYALIEQAKSKCLGSFVFLWGQKQETTGTWYGVFSKDGDKTEIINDLQKAWTGVDPKNRSPKVGKLQIKENETLLKENYLQARGKYQAEVNFTDPDKDKLKIRWVIRYESTDIKSGGDAEKEPPSIPGLIKKKRGQSVHFVAPKKEGAYRLYVMAYDKSGHVAYANIPFYVKPDLDKQKIRLKKRNLNPTY